MSSRKAVLSTPTGVTDTALREAFNKVANEAFNAYEKKPKESSQSEHLVALTKDDRYFHLVDSKTNRTLCNKEVHKSFYASYVKSDFEVCAKCRSRQ